MNADEVIAKHATESATQLKKTILGLLKLNSPAVAIAVIIRICSR